MTDFKNYKFRASQVGKLMVGLSKGLTEKQTELFGSLKEKMKIGKITDKQIVTYGQLLEKKNQKPKLSVGAKSFLEEIHKEVLFGKSKEIVSKYLDKGLQVEEKAITLYSDVTNNLFVKNVKHFKNEYLTGTPDMVTNQILDIKSSWDFSTFPMNETEIPTKIYYWQLLAYMDLTGLKNAELIYCLVDTPNLLIEDEKRRTSWKLGFQELPEELEKEIENNLTYSSIPKELRIKIFKTEYSDKDVKTMKIQIDLARDYLTELSLKIADRLELVA